MQDLRTRAREPGRPRAIQRPQAQHTGAHAGARAQQRFTRQTRRNKNSGTPVQHTPAARQYESQTRSILTRVVRPADGVMRARHIVSCTPRTTIRAMGAKVRRGPGPYACTHACTQGGTRKTQTVARMIATKATGISTSTGRIGAPEPSHTLISEAFGALIVAKGAGLSTSTGRIAAPEASETLIFEAFGALTAAKASVRRRTRTGTRAYCKAKAP